MNGYVVNRHPWLSVALALLLFVVPTDCPDCSSLISASSCIESAGLFVFRNREQLSHVQQYIQQQYSCKHINTTTTTITVKGKGKVESAAPSSPCPVPVPFAALTIFVHTRPASRQQHNRLAIPRTGITYLSTARKLQPPRTQLSHASHSRQRPIARLRRRKQTVMRSNTGCVTPWLLCRCLTHSVCRPRLLPSCICLRRAPR